MTEQAPITTTTIAEGEKLVGLEFSEDERTLMSKNLERYRKLYEQLRTLPLDNSVAPALAFDPRLPGMSFPTEHQALVQGDAPPPPARDDRDRLAFATVTQLAQLIQSRQISSLELTQLYLDRLGRYDSDLHCVVTLTEELALAQARHADEEIAAGRYRGPLHGIPWGAKDLLATKGIPTTWGAEPYQEQVPDHDAAVVQRLEAAGAVLVAKLTMGALAWGDVWFGGKTRNPWEVNEGSSGSSAGSGSATAAGLVGFSIGTETWGSITSPSTVCGVTGLRPTFGRVSRHGAMALSWSMDKIGPMCRSVEDCALVFDAVYGPDGRDGSVADLPFNWNGRANVSGLRVGYVKNLFDEAHDSKAYDDRALETLRSLGINLIPISLPDYPIEAMSFILHAEAAAAFDELTRSGRDDLLARQGEDAWPNVFRTARLISAVEYIQANRLRRLVMEAMAAMMEPIDVYVVPTDDDRNSLLTNLTGHPAVVVPSGFTERNTPTSISFIGKLYNEAATLTVAKAFQDATDYHLKRPRMNDKG